MSIIDAIRQECVTFNQLSKFLIQQVESLEPGSGDRNGYATKAAESATKLASLMSLHASTDSFEDNVTIGGLASTLEKMDPGKMLRFDDGSIPSLHVESHEGYFQHGAIGDAGIQETVTAGRMAHSLRWTLGRTKTGRKGGEYLMLDETPLWASGHRHELLTAITGVTDGPEYAVLHTKKIE